MAKWFYLTDGQQQGPIEPAALKQLATTGRLKPTDKVRREDMAEWFKAKQVKGLFDIPEQQSRVSQKAFGLLLDPDNGIPLPDAQARKTTRKYATLDFIIQQFSQLKSNFVVCFDQSHDRHRSKLNFKIDKQRGAKQRHLFNSGIHSFYYLSHAPFLFMADKKAVINKVRELIRSAGVPEHRLQQIFSE